MTEEEELLFLAALKRWIAEHTPAGTRLRFGEGGHFPEFALTCDGADAIMGYYCCRPAGHTGRCYTAEKQVDFTRTTITWSDL